MATFEDSLYDTIRNAFCTYLDTFEGFIGNLAANPFTPFAKIPLATTRLTQRLVCNREPPSYSNPPYSGGQCATNYNINIIGTYTQPSTGATVPFNRTYGPGPGPFYSITFGYKPDPGDGSDFGLGTFLTNPSGTGFVPLISGVAPGTNDPTSVTSITVTRADGLPDDCGNPLPPTPGDYTPTPVFVPVPYEDNDGNTWNIPIVLVFAPIRVGINGTLNVPFQVNIDPTFNVSFNGNINIGDGNVNIDFGNPNFPPGLSPQPDDYDTDDDIPDYPPDVPNSISPISPDPPEPDTVEIIRAVIVTVTSNSSNASEIFQDNNPSIFAPNLGYVNFGIAVNNAVAWTSDIPVKNERNFIICDWEGGAIDVRGTPRQGVTWVLTPVRIRSEKPVQFA